MQCTFYTHARLALCTLAACSQSNKLFSLADVCDILKIRHSTIKFHQTSAYRHPFTLVTKKIKYPGTNIIILIVLLKVGPYNELYNQFVCTIAAPDMMYLSSVTFDIFRVCERTYYHKQSFRPPVFPNIAKCGKKRNAFLNSK